MKIKTKTGEIIDLDELRRQKEMTIKIEDRQWEIDEAQRTIALLDALDAVLSVKERRYWEAGCHDGGSLAGWNDCVEEVRKLAGVVEEQHDAER